MPKRSITGSVCSLPSELQTPPPPPVLIALLFFCRVIPEKLTAWGTTVTAFTAHETLHLIPESEMLAVDSKGFPDYEYCPISESKNRPKDAKIQFVAVILSRPVVVSGQRLQWLVADKTGTVSMRCRAGHPIPLSLHRVSPLRARKLSSMFFSPTSPQCFTNLPSLLQIRPTFTSNTAVPGLSTRGNGC